MKKNIYYKSTRGICENKNSSEAIIHGIADDGGLFIPSKIPQINIDFKKWKAFDYQELAYRIMSEYFTDFTEAELRYCIKQAYNEKFDIETIAPIEKKSGVYFLELFHGPTLAFKDLALSILPHLMQIAAKKINLNKDIIILTATSGDTGKAALEGFSDVPGTKIIVFFPLEGVSPIQKKQMITQKGNNAHVIAIRGNFDDAQKGVKEIFSNQEFNEEIREYHMIFSSANSINIGRLVPQIVYYFYAYLKMLTDGEIIEDEKINLVVPTGNFGNILAAYYAKEMGLPVNRLICASNENNVLTNFFNNGTYDRRRELIVTISPSMDILISSNLERLLYLGYDGNSKKIKKIMEDLNKKGFFHVNKDNCNIFNSFYGGYASQEEALLSIREIFTQSGYLIDPHTAVGYSVYQKYLSKTSDPTKTVMAATASPFKFTMSVMGAINQKFKYFNDFELIERMSNISKISIPFGIKNIQKKPILHKTVCEKEKMKDALSEILFK